MCADMLQFNNVYEHRLKLEKIGPTVSTFLKTLCLQKSDTVTKLLWLMLPDENCLISSSEINSSIFFTSCYNNYNGVSTNNERAAILVCQKIQ